MLREQVGRLCATTLLGLDPSRRTPTAAQLLASQRSSESFHVRNPLLQRMLHLWSPLFGIDVWSRDSWPRQTGALEHVG